MTISNRMTLRRPCLCGQCLIGWASRIAAALVGTFSGLVLLGLISGAVHLGGTPGLRACHTPSMPAGSTISVDRQGNASSPANGGLELACANGTWVRIVGAK